MGRTTREEWATRIAKWRESGKTAAEFASEIGVSVRTLSWWKWRLASNSSSGSPKLALNRQAVDEMAKRPKRISPLTFVEMTSSRGAERLEVVLPSSIRIVVRPGFDNATLGHVLDVLERRR